MGQFSVKISAYPGQVSVEINMQPSQRFDVAGFTARLTIDVTPELRGRIKIAAFRRGVTVADMLRDLLAREFAITEGDQP